MHPAYSGMRRAASPLVVGNPEGVQEFLDVVLTRERGAPQVARLARVLGEPAVVVRLELIGDDEGHHAVLQALLQRDEPAHAAVAVLERVDALEPPVEFEDLVQANLVGVRLAQVRVPRERLCHAAFDLFGSRL